MSRAEISTCEISSESALGGSSVVVSGLVSGSGVAVFSGAWWA